MRPEIAAAIERLRAQLREIEAGFEEVFQTLASVDTALDSGDREEASRLLTSACDLEHELTLDSDGVAPLFDELGLEDGAGS
jgi:hypothetical protein